MRPSEVILNAFYGIADLNDATRFKAIASLLKNADSDEVRDYCIERLVGGLSSARAAARIGYSTSLAQLLPTASEDWPAERLFRLADAKMDLADREMDSHNAIGHHLLLTAMVSSGVYTADNGRIAEKELLLCEVFPWLAMSGWDAVTRLAEAYSSKEFNSAIWGIIKKKLPTIVKDYQPEHLFTILSLAQKFGATISETVPFVSKKGGVKFNEETITSLHAVLKNTDATSIHPIIRRLVNISRTSGQFSEVYRGLIEAWAIGGDDSKILERLFDTAEFVLEGGTDHNEVLAVLSPNLMKRISYVTQGRNTPEKKAVKTRLREFTSVISEHITEVSDGKFILSLLALFDAVGDFDHLVGTRFTEKLVSKLDGDSLITFLKQAETSAGWYVRRVSPAFATWSVENRKTVLLSLASAAFPKTEDRHVTIANCVDMLFKLKVRPGELATVTVTEDDESLLRSTVEGLDGKEAVKKALKKIHAADSLTRPFTVLWLCIRLWAGISPDAEEVDMYNENAEEIITLAQNCAKDKQSTKILIDLLIALLGQPRKHHRSVAYFVYTHVLPTIKQEDVKHILETLALSDEELAGGDEEIESDDEEMMELDEDDLPKENDEAGCSSGSDDDESDDQESDGEVDQELVDRLQKALGKAAAKPVDGDDSEEESADSEVDDDEMFKLDAGLAEAFKAIAGAKASKKVKPDAARFAQPLRAKLADLLLFTLSSTLTPPLVKLGIAVPLLALAKTQLKRGGDEAATKKAFELLDVVSHMKKLEVPEKRILKTIEELTEEAVNITNPTLKNLVSNLASWLFALGVKGDEVSPTVKKTFVELLDKFMTQEDGHLGSELATASLLKYPNIFSSELPKLIEYAFSEDVRIFRRTEALQCAVAMMRKDVVLQKTTVQSVGNNVQEYLKDLTPEEVKPRFLAVLLKLVSGLCTVTNEKQKAVLSSALSEVVDSLVENTALWSQGGSMKKTFAPCQQLTGKTPLALLKNIQKELN